jgi:hypothetical protein
MEHHTLFALVSAAGFLPVLGCALGWLGGADGPAPAERRATPEGGHGPYPAEGRHSCLSGGKA